MDDVIVSIIVPVYNTGKYLRDCLKSIRGQSFSNWECVIVDDGSTDNSFEICKEFANDDSRFVVIRQKNAGVSSARNKALDFAQGKYVCFVDSDDVLLENALRELVKMKELTNSGLIVANAWKSDKNNKLLLFKEEDKTVTGEVLPVIKNFALWAQLFDLILIKEKHLRFIEGLAYSEDALFVCQYALLVNAISIASFPVYIYRVNMDSACRTPNKERIARHQFLASSKFGEMALSVSNKKNKDFLKNQENIRIKWGVEAFIKSSHRFNIPKQMNCYYESASKRISFMCYMRIYLYTLYKCCKISILEYLRNR